MLVRRAVNFLCSPSPASNALALMAAPIPKDELSCTLEILAALLGPEGCPWTKAQAHETLAQYAVEEAYELADVIGSGQTSDIREELGDLWLQVVYHAAIAEEFDAQDVDQTLKEKLIRRQPHVFGDRTVQNADEVADNWDQITVYT